MLDILHTHGGLVGLAAVGKDLHMGTTVMTEITGEAAPEDDRHIDAATSEQGLYLCTAVRRVGHDEIATGRNMAADLGGDGVMRQIEYGHTYILHLCGDGIAEQQDEHDRIDQ